MESHATAERGEIVRKDAGGAAESEHHAVGEQLALGRELIGKAVKDEIEVQLSGDGDVKTRHEVVSVILSVGQ